MSLLLGYTYTAELTSQPRSGYIRESGPPEMSSYRAYLRPVYKEHLQTQRQFIADLDSHKCGSHSLVALAIAHNS